MNKFIFLVVLVFVGIRSQYSCQYGYDERKSFQSTYDEGKNNSFEVNLPWFDHQCSMLIDVNGFIWAETAKSEGENIVNRIDISTGQLLFSVKVPSHDHSKNYITLTSEGDFLFYASENPGVISRVDKNGKVGGWWYDTTFVEVVNVAFYSPSDKEDLLLFQSLSDVIRAIKYPIIAMGWSYSTGTGPGMGPITFFKNKIYIVTNGPPYYMIKMDSETGKVLNKVPFVGNEVNDFNAKLDTFPKLTIYDGTECETIYYISNRVVEKNNSATLYSLDCNFSLKWYLDFTAPYLMKCADGIVLNEHIVLPCWYQFNNNETFTNLFVINHSGSIVRSYDNIKGTCEKLAVNSGGNGLLWMKCPNTVYRVDVSMNKLSAIVEADVVYDVTTDLAGCVYYVTGDNRYERVKLFRNCELS